MSPTLDVPSGQPVRVATPAPGDPRLSRFSLNQRTVASWSLREAIDGCLAAGVPAVGVWREQLAQAGLERAAGWLSDAGLRVSSLCRGGLFTAADPAEVRQTEQENRRAIDEAAAIGARTLVLVAGGLPAGDRDLRAARKRAAAALDALVPYAHDAGVALGVEPMHPIYAADRGVVSTLGQALDLTESYAADEVGVVVDTFHLWWEPELERQLNRAGARILSYQVGDWITPLPPDALLARGMMGDGHVDFAAFSAAVVGAGYRGDVEVEIFNADLRAAPGPDVLATSIRRYVELVEPHLR